MSNHKTQLLAKLALCAAVGVAAVPAQRAAAAAFQLHENSTVSLGTAFAGAGSAADTPATAFSNPAGLTQLDGVQFYDGGSLIAPSFTFHGGATNAFGLPISGNGNAQGGHDAFVPYGYASWRVNDLFAVGLAVTSPFGLETYYGPDFVGRYQTTKTSLTTVDINPNVAMKITNWLSIGFGVSLNRATAQFGTAINSTTIGYGVFGALVPLPDGEFRLRDSDNYAVGYNAGGLIVVDPSTRIGFTYRSRIQHDFTGAVQFNVPYPLSLNPGFSNGPGAVKFVLPDTATASITHAFSPRLTTYADVSWTDWSVFKSLNVYRTSGQLVSTQPDNYRDTVFASVGASYKLTDRLTVRGGGGFDLTPTTNADRNAQVPDANRYLVAAGASYEVLPRTTVDIAYSHIFLDSPSITQLSSTGDVLSGHFDDSVDIVSLGLRTVF